MIRPGTEEDFPRLKQLLVWSLAEGTLGPEHETDPKVIIQIVSKALLDREGVWICEDDKREIVGFLLWIAATDAKLVCGHGAYLLPKHRGKQGREQIGFDGLAKMAAEYWLTQGRTRILSAVRKDNARALSLATAFGYEVSGYLLERELDQWQ